MSASLTYFLRRSIRHAAIGLCLAVILPQAIAAKPYLVVMSFAMQVLKRIDF